LARRANEVAQHGHIGTVSADAPCIHGQTQLLSEVEIDARIIQLGQTESLRRQHAINPCWIHRPRRPMTLPRAARQFIKLFPIPFVPSCHFVVFYYSST